MQQRSMLRAISSAIAVTTAMVAMQGDCKAQETQISWAVIGTGGVMKAGDGTMWQSSTVGQSAIGSISTGNSTINQGFWLPRVRVSSVANDLGTNDAINLRNYPNPFSTTTTIAYRLSEPCRVRLTIVDPVGAEIARLVDGIEGTGEHFVLWNGTNAADTRVGEGVYFYLLTTQPTASNSASVHIERQQLVLMR